MATRLDVARALKGSSSGTSKTATASNVRYGTASGASADGQVTVVLDGSTEAVTLKTDADVAQGERVRVVSQGGSYAVVALKGVSAAASAASETAGAAKTAADTASATASAASATATAASSKADTASATATAAASAASAAQAAAEATQTLIRETSKGVEVAKVTSTGAYSGTRATLGADALTFTNRTGVTTLAEFGANGATLGSALGQHVSIGTDSFNIVKSAGDVLISIGSTSLGPYIDGDGSLELRSSDTLPTAKATLGTTTSGSTKTGTAKLYAYNPSDVLKYTTLTLDSSSGLTFAVGSANKLKVTSTTLACSALKAVPETKTLVSSTVTAYRHMGMVTVRFDNWTSSAITTAGSYQVGTLAAGWRPPARVKAPLYCDPFNNLFIYVETGGAVKVYAPDKVASTVRMSGTVTFIATQ